MKSEPAAVAKSLKHVSEIDRSIGFRLQSLRAERGLSAAELGRLAGMSGDQVRKFETGLNRIGAAQLFVLSKVLAAPIAAFFPIDE